MNVYYLNKDHFNKGDTTKAFEFALRIIEDDNDIDTITFLVYQQRQYEPFLGELGFKLCDYKKHVVKTDGFTIQLHTVKTYNPKYQFANQPQSELLIAVGVPPRYLEKFEDYSNIKYWIIVPWLLDESLEWLSIFEAEDIDTGKALAFQVAVDARIVKAIEWLNDTSYPNEGYPHPLDEDRLHQVANAIKHYKVPFNYASTVYCALHHGQIPSSARYTAKAFLLAQMRAFTVKYGPYDLSFLK